ncbi:MAG: AmmeMemoRadiSam system radical SAM enzyme [Proteobacteria bacterium]|nr:AmmeMemoRadiSam system radical SAM enzyme [Pseudomonadota bacterium]MBU1388214.1 AmmeMemoRadiSam system radical SAM enzyme [Pseudomonadota bacterium]MBU1543026.1 AmmeMemoRadiSam system radical SAM enzyme [Pseudomonadota bacterium]MBU2481598.1 AmmeMemoRadiSam system radical SAM enzyme [Pseudomonadota bacterium]
METLIYEKLENRTVRCGICHHFCIIKEGRKGICAVRENNGGALVSLVYDKLVAAGIDPIEKKPLFHLKPGSYSYSIAAPGCNFACRFCQNANIAQMSGEKNSRIPGARVQPETIVANAQESGCKSISYTYTEPTVFFELALETARLARKNGLLNVFVTNGFMSSDVLDMISPYLDAANVDLKAFDDQFYQTYCHARLEPVKANLKLMKQMGILLEITTLLIPGLNDTPEELAASARFIAGELGPETPWHISRFHPTHKMTDRPVTPLASLETAYAIGKDAGLRYVYIGNVPGQSFENTFCHSCNKMLIQRHGYTIKNYLKDTDICPGCGTPVYGRF